MTAYNINFASMPSSIQHVYVLYMIALTRLMFNPLRLSWMTVLYGRSKLHPQPHNHHLTSLAAVLHPYPQSPPFPPGKNQYPVNDTTSNHHIIKSTRLILSHNTFIISSKVIQTSTLTKQRTCWSDRRCDHSE